VIQRPTLSPMAMGRRRDRADTPGLWISVNDPPPTGSHPFYRRLNHILDTHGFDAFVESQCAGFYAAKLGPTRADLARLDRKRPKKGRNTDWQHQHDSDARITRMKDGRTHLAYKAEHAVDMGTGAGSGERDSVVLECLGVGVA